MSPLPVSLNTQVPLDGFDPPFTIVKSELTGDAAFPRSHTCFNQISLPEYSSYAVLKTKLREAIECVDEGFHMT
jgi:hypothetical protein